MERAVRACPARVRLWCGLISLVAKEHIVSSGHPHLPPAREGSKGRTGATSPMQPLLTRFSEFQNGLFLESQFLEHHFSELRKGMFLNYRNLFSLCQLDIDFLKITLFSLVLVSLKIPMLFLGLWHPGKVRGMKYCFLPCLLHHSFSIRRKVASVIAPQQCDVLKRFSQGGSLSYISISTCRSFESNLFLHLPWPGRVSVCSQWLTLVYTMNPYLAKKRGNPHCVLWWQARSSCERAQEKYSSGQFWKFILGSIIYLTHNKVEIFKRWATIAQTFGIGLSNVISIL